MDAAPVAERWPGEPSHPPRLTRRTRLGARREQGKCTGSSGRWQGRQRPPRRGLSAKGALASLYLVSSLDASGSALAVPIRRALEAGALEQLITSAEGPEGELLPAVRRPYRHALRVRDMRTTPVA